MPYAPDPVRDLACSLVAVAPTPASSGVTLSVTPGEGALFPFPADILIWADGVLPLRTGSSPAEEARLTGVVGDTLTVVRAQGTPVTSAIAVTVGMRVATVRSAAQILADQAQISANTVAIAGKVSSVTAADGSVTIGGTATAPTVHANVPTIADASTSVKGIVELATAPASPTSPIAVGDNDPRNVNARTPTAHKASHATGGTDVLLPSDIGAVPTAALGVSVATLVSGKLPASQLTVDAVEFQGVWNASTNSPTLSDGTGNPGDLYRVSVAGSQNLGSGSVTYAVGDDVILDQASVWQRIGGGVAPGIAAGLQPTTVKASGTYAASAGDLVLVDLSQAAVAITLPPTPLDQSQVGYKIVRNAVTASLSAPLYASTTLSTPLTVNGLVVVSLGVAALPVGAPYRGQLVISSGSHSQTFIVDAAAAASATAVTVVGEIPNFAYPAGSTVQYTPIVSSLLVTGLSGAMPSGAKFITSSGNYLQAWTTSGATSAGASTVAVQPQAANFIYPSGSGCSYKPGNVLTITAAGGFTFTVAGGSTTQSAIVKDQAKTYQALAGSSLWLAVSGDTAMGELDARFGTDGATLYVTTAGNDTNSGRSWGNAFATIPAAINALPLAEDGVSRTGIVEVGYGVFGVASSSRVDAGCAMVAGSQVVMDSAVTSADKQSIILDSVDIFDNGATIIDVVPGVSFTMSQPATISITQSLTIVKPAIQGATALKVRGRGRKGGNNNVYSTGTCTVIQDSGTGITIAGPSGVNPDNQTTSVFTVEDLTVYGPGNKTGNAATNNIYGYFVTQAASMYIKQCDFQYHGRWGVFFGPNATVGGAMRECHVQYNGTAAAAIMTGGVYCSESGPPEYLFERVRILNNFGVGAQLSGNMQCDSCVFGSAQPTAWSSGTYPALASGVGAIIAAGSVAPTILNNVEWQDNTGLCSFYVTPGGNLIMTGGGGSGNTTQAYVVYIANGLQSQVTLDGVASHQQTVATIFVQAGFPPQLSWRNCNSLDPLWLKLQGGSSLPAGAASGSGTNFLTLLGKPGAASLSGYAGATAAGAPTTGTFGLGEWIVDLTGGFWVCTAAGSPGTWTAVGGSTITAGANTFSGIQTAPAFSAAGLTGAVAGGRFAGATSGGAPTTGAFLARDFVVDTSGAMYVCTAAGTPGTWVGVGAASSADRLPGLVTAFSPLLMNALKSMASANNAWTVRVTVPKTGTLHDLTIFQGTASGNICVGIYDTGDASAGNRTRLYTTGSIACPAANGVRTVGDPGLAVVAGQQLDFALAADNTTASFGGLSVIESGYPILPASFLPAAGGASPKLNGAVTAGFPLPSTISEVNVGQNGGVILIVARVA